jgi:ATP-dependent Lon protease
MMKLIYPDGKMTDEEAFELIDFAAECRKESERPALHHVDPDIQSGTCKVFKYVNLKTGKEVKC